MALTFVFDFIAHGIGNCDECHEPLDEDRQTIILIIEGKGPLQFHQVCAWKRATFMFGELF